MVTFARDRQYCPCETTASVNQGETGSMGADGPQSVCPKEHIFALRMRGQFRKLVVSPVR
jgi:hypothetical protein